MSDLLERMNRWLSDPAPINEAAEVKMWELMGIPAYTWAIRLLKRPLAIWQESPSSGKKELFAVYDKFHPDLVAALDKENRKAIGSSTIIGWRWSARGQSAPTDLGGQSLHAEVPVSVYASLRADNLTAYEVKSSDVLTYYATPENEMNNARYSNEKEMILKKGARPKQLSDDAKLKILEKYGIK